jgi:hypothetical protein
MRSAGQIEHAGKKFLHFGRKPEADKFEDPNVVGILIFKKAKKQDGRMCIELIWLRIRTSGKTRVNMIKNFRVP